MPVSTAELVDLIAKSKMKLNTIGSLLKSLRNLQENQVENIYEFEQQIIKLKKMMASLDDITLINTINDWLSIQSNLIESQKIEKRRNFGINLETLLKANNLSLSGHYPLLKTNIYSIELDFDKQSSKIWYGPQEELIIRSKLSTSEIVKQILKINLSLIERSIPKDFIPNLYQAYLNLIEGLNLSKGDRVPLTNILMEYVLLSQEKGFKFDPRTEKFKGCSRYQFSYNIFKALQADNSSKRISIIPATQNTSLKREDYIWIPRDLNGNGERCSFIYFHEAER